MVDELAVFQGRLAGAVRLADYRWPVERQRNAKDAAPLFDLHRDREKGQERQGCAPRTMRPMTGWLRLHRPSRNGTSRSPYDQIVLVNDVIPARGASARWRSQADRQKRCRKDVAVVLPHREGRLPPSKPGNANRDRHYRAYNRQLRIARKLLGFCSIFRLAGKWRTLVSHLVSSSVFAGCSTLTRSVSEGVAYGGTALPRLRFGLVF
jgi:hypothetical protein